MRGFCLRTFVFILFLFVLSACGSKSKLLVPYSSTEPLRVMVLPFVHLDSDGEIIEKEKQFFLDGVPLVSEELAHDPAELMRQLVQAELADTNLDVLSPYLVNIELPHHGFAKTSGAFDLKKIYSAQPSDLCSHFLDCDAVLYGKVTKWDRSYYAVETVNSVGLHLRLVSAKTGKVLYEVESKDSEGRGLTGGPTGFSDIVLEPLKGLDSKYIEEVAREVAKLSVESLKTTPRLESIQSPAPSIYAVAHTPNTLKGVLGTKVVVLAYASPGARASFSFGEELKGFPMTEVEPGHYVGEYFPIAGEKLGRSLVVVELVDQVGRKTSQKSASGSLEIS